MGKTLNDCGPFLIKSEDLEYTLEELVDTHTLAKVLDSLSTMCSGKADHVATNWQDKDLAKRWEVMGRLLDTVANKAQQKGI